MFSLFFGSYLVKKNVITKEQFDAVLEYQKTTRVKLGLIAVAENLLTTKQADEVNQLQATMDKRFGDIAVEKGYLTDEQVGHLLSLQGNPYLLFTQSVVDKNILTLEQVNEQLEKYQSDHSFSSDDIDALKSGDIDLITPLFVKISAPYYYEYISLMVRNLVRFASTEIYFENAYRTNSYSSEHMAIQELKGEHAIFVSLAGNQNALLKVAIPYGKEEFETVDEDSYDAVCEFINCVNGLFASKLSHDNVDVDMLPPAFKDDAAITTENAFYVLPMTISGERIDLVLAIDHTISL